MIKAIIFDCFGVLYVDATHYFYEENVQNYEQLRPALHELHRTYDSGFITQSELNHQVADLTGLDEDFVTVNILGLHQRNDKLLSYGQSLRKHYKIGLLSNIGTDGMSSFFSLSEQKLLFDSVVLSSTVGMIKPDPAIFELMAQRLGVQPEECIMIDDIQENVEGAGRAGMHAILHSTNQQTELSVTRLLAL